MSSTTTPKLFSPFILGTITWQHRVVIAPLTRLRRDQPGDIPGDLMAEYYAQRASPGGLIVPESAEITPEASAYEGAPGIYFNSYAVWNYLTSLFLYASPRFSRGGTGNVARTRGTLAATQDNVRRPCRHA